ncbi:nicotinate phosphoribosyltransferase [Myroides sp. LJL116]
MQSNIQHPIITSILDNDFYKFTMQHAAIKQFPYAKASYVFINRGDHKYPDGFAEALQDQVNKMADLRLTKAEKDFLAKTCPYLDPTYLDFLEGYSYNPNEVEITQDKDQLTVNIQGYWYRSILWEVPLMSLICELYYILTGAQPMVEQQIIETTKNKIENYKKLGITIAEFGTRRRYSYKVHSIVVETLKKYGSACFIGTSNVHLAMVNNIKPIGTHAHEWFMFHAAKYGFKMANSMGLEHWVDTYRGDLGIALTDTYTSEVFFEHFDKKFAKLFDGVRHDSGDPIEFAQMTINHYKSLNIDPRSKTIIFSDGLNPEKVQHITHFCRGKIGMSFGIGTDFTNDVGLPAMNIVIKMSQALPEKGNWTDVVKLSDEPKKHTGTPEMIELAQRLLDIPLIK